MFKKMQLYFELMICDKYRGKNTSPQCVNRLMYCAKEEGFELPSIILCILG
jgi:hypothetical protein